MAIIAFGSSKALPQKGIDYILDENKVECSAVLNLAPNMDYAEQMMSTQKLFGKGDTYDERKYWHLKIAFSPMDKKELGGKVDPEKAMQFSQDVMEKFFPNHEAVLTCQNHGKDKTPKQATRHVHIIVNSVDSLTGEKIHMTHEQRRAIKDYVQELSAQYGFKVLDWRKAEAEAREQRKKGDVRSSKAEKLTYAEESLRDKNGRPIAPEKLTEPVDWKEHTKEILQFAKEQSCNFEDFEKSLKEFGLSVRRTASTISYCYPGHKNGIRSERLGEEFTPEALEKQFAQVRAKLDEFKKIKSIVEQRQPVPAPAKLSAEQIRENEKGYLKDVIRYAKSRSRSMEEFENELKEYGVTLNRNTANTISYRIEATGRTVRGSSLGSEFDAKAVRETLSGRPMQPEEVKPEAPAKLAEGEVPADEKAYIRKIIDYAKTTSKSMEEFEQTLKEYRITLPRNTEKTVSFSFDGNKAVRGSTLGDGYSAEQIRAAIDANAENEKPNTGSGEGDSGGNVGGNMEAVTKPAVSDDELQMQLAIMRQELIMNTTAASRPDPAKRSTGWKDQIRAIVSYAKATCTDKESFVATLKEYGVTCPVHGNNIIVYHHPGVNKDVRGDTLGNDFTAAKIEEALGRNKYNQEHYPEETPIKVPPELKAAFRTLGRIAGIDDATVDRTIADADSRVLTKEETEKLWNDFKRTTSTYWEQRKTVSSELDFRLNANYESIHRLKESLETDKEFWASYRDQKAAINEELSAAFQELRAARAASWTLNPRNRKASLFAIFQAVVYKCRQDPEFMIQHRIHNLKLEQERLRDSVERHRYHQERIRAELDDRYARIKELKAKQSELKDGTADFRAMSDDVYNYLKGSKTTDNLARYESSLMKMQEQIEDMNALVFNRAPIQTTRKPTLDNQINSAGKKAADQAAEVRPQKMWSELTEEEKKALSFEERTKLIAAEKKLNPQKKKETLRQ